MKGAVALVVAFIAAALLPALAIVVPYAYGSLSMGDGYGWARTRNFGAMALAVSAGHVVLLGIPTFALLKWKNAIRWWSSALAGFVLGCLPVGIWSWPLLYPELRTSSSQWDGERMVQTMIDGVPTFAGWISYTKGIVFMGAFGAVGGVAFWLVWRALRPNSTLHPDARATLVLDQPPSARAGERGR